MQTIAIQQFDALMYVEQANFIIWHIAVRHPVNGFLTDPVTSVFDRDSYPVIFLFNRNCYHTFAATRLYSVHNGVFN